MSQTQRIRYCLKEQKFKEISSGKGILEYILIDEFGNSRTVSAMAKLNWRKQLTTVKPIHHRESPLIEALSLASINETIEVDFTEFNKKFTRGSIRKQKISIPNVKVTNKHYITDVSSVVENKGRLVQLAAFTIAGFAALMMLLQIA